MPANRLRVFVSSKMQELALERAITKTALDDLEVDAWVFEEDAGARPQSIQQTFLEEVQHADLYIGIFWKGFGEYTVEEFDHAVQLGKDCLVYEKRGEIDGERDPQLQNFLDRLAAVNTGITIRWFNSPQELGNFVKEDVARWQAAIVRQAMIAGAPAFQSRQTPVEAAARKDLLILLKKVRQFWIEGVLENSVHNESVIALGKKRLAAAVEHPWESVLELPDRSVESISSDRSMAGVFDEVGNFLLILGDPGSGKTVSLLELARDLLNLSEHDSARPVPVIFNLSSWINKNQSIPDWIVSELKSKYQIPEKIGKTWIEAQRLLVLLDGLDEVRSDLQRDCVKAINRFIGESPCGLVVCCRIVDYTELNERLKLNAAISLQPLTLEQIDGYLMRGGDELNALRVAVMNDPGLQTLIQTPLMLSVMSLAYHGRSVAELGKNSDATVEEQQRNVFDTYIERMFERKGKASQIYPKEKVLNWLGWLGREMQTRSQTVFLIENLQPDWLATKRQALIYFFVSRMVAGILLSLGLSVPIWVQGVFDYAGGMQGVLDNLLRSTRNLTLLILGLSLVTAGVDAGWYATNEMRQRPLGKLIRKPIVGFLVCFLTISPLAVGLDVFEGGVTALETRLVWIVGFATVLSVFQWIVFGGIGMAKSASDDIVMIELLRFSWTGALRSCLWSVGIALVIALPLVIVSNYQSRRDMKRSYRSRVQNDERAIQSQIEHNRAGDETSAEDLERLQKLERDRDNDRNELARMEREPPIDLNETLLVALVLSMIGGIPVGVMVGGLKSKVLEGKTLPNQGIRMTARNAVVGGLGLGTVLGSIAGLALWIIPRLLSGTTSILDSLSFALIVASGLGILVAFRLGFITLVKHFFLRVLLIYTGKIPRNYSRFLNYCTKLIFLQRVGGGYIFIHRMLLEHFASLGSRSQAPNTEHQVRPGQIERTAG